MVWRHISEVLEAAMIDALSDGGCDMRQDPGKGQPAQLGEDGEIGSGRRYDREEDFGAPTAYPASVPAESERERPGAGRLPAVDFGVGNKNSAGSAGHALTRDASRSIATVMHRPLREPAPGSAVVIDLLAERERRAHDVSRSASGLSSSAAAKLARSISP